MKIAFPRTAAVLVWLMALIVVHARAAEQLLDGKQHHLRSGDQREWDEFPQVAEGRELAITFAARSNTAESCLLVRHRDLKYDWRVTLNEQSIGRLPGDENPIVTLLAVPPGVLKEGDNHLVISPSQALTDDIWVGDLRLVDCAAREFIGRATLAMAVTDDEGRGIPCRLTIVDREGYLVPLGAGSNDQLAVRPGMVYTADGAARIGVAAGDYTVYAGRGPEFSVASVQVRVAAGEVAQHNLQIQREVQTLGYVSCDTHVHTRTFSGHGDASIDERMLTIAGEGLELPIATDHNVHTDFEPYARRLSVRRHFTPVVGNEVTTRIGHFNVFPIAEGARPPDFQAADWPRIFDSIFATPGVQVVILNHPRDLHGGFRPFDPAHYDALLAEDLTGRQLRANATEVLNSGALQSDLMRLYEDWFGLLNRGLQITPIGSSDSHDVARKLVSQGRTYIECPDQDPAAIDVMRACESLREGRVLVSMGLFTEITVDDRYKPGDLAPAGDELQVAVRVQGPTWIEADRVVLYANGIAIREARITPASAPQVLKWRGEWALPRPQHDLHLVAIATGPGVTAPYWRIPRPYQPTSSHWEPYVVGSTGAVWIDGDRDGRRTSAFEYATAAVDRAHGDFASLMATVKGYDEIVAAHVAGILATQGRHSTDPEIKAALDGAAEATRRGFWKYLESRPGRAIPH